jgi:lactate permease
MYQQVYDPVAQSLGLTSIFAAIPLTLMFIMLGVFKRSPQLSALVSLLAALAVATVIYPMPIAAALQSGLFGVAFAILTIAWILVNAMWIYNMTVETGHFHILRESFSHISEDLRIQAIIIAFCFGALIEALAGSGVPIAICSAMLVAIGFEPIKAAVVSLVANTAPVAFGALAVPITTLNRMTDLPYMACSAPWSGGSARSSLSSCLSSSCSSSTASAACARPGRRRWRAASRSPSLSSSSRISSPYPCPTSSPASPRRRPSSR